MRSWVCEGCFEALGCLDILSGRVDAMDTVLPKLSGKSLEPVRIPSLLQPAGTARRRVGLITGCVQQVLFGEVNAATARTLLAEGCEVVVPPEQGCCGALELHAGEEERTLGKARS